MGAGCETRLARWCIDVLAVHPEINVIFAINDDSAQGALDAYRAAGLDERKLLVVAFGLEGAASRRLLQEGGPFKAGVAMFPEMVGRACVDAAVCAYHNCAMPGRIMTPYAVVTARHVGAVLPMGAADRRFPHQLGGGRTVADSQCGLRAVGRLRGTLQALTHRVGAGFQLARMVPEYPADDAGVQSFPRHSTRGAGCQPGCGTGSRGLQARHRLRGGAVS